MKNNNFLVYGVGAVLVVFIGSYFTPTGRAVINNFNYSVQKTDDATNYQTRKQVEDSCRAMIVTYNSDKITYEAYKDSENQEERRIATQAKIRANGTAQEYNNYILKNSFVWAGNIPEDINQELPILE